MPYRRNPFPEEQRRPFYLYVDEFQAFMNLSVGFDRILAEARKYRLVLAGLANQYVGQLTPSVRAAIFGNVGTLATFRLGIDDANILQKEMGIFTAEEILNLELGEAFARVGGSATAFNLRSYPPPPLESNNPTRIIVANTRARFATPRSHVEAAWQLHQKQMATGASNPTMPAHFAPTPNQTKNTKSRRRRKSKTQSAPPPQNTPSDPSEDDFVS